MRDSVPSGSYSSVCNVLRQWKSRSSLLIESTDSMIYTIPIRANSSKRGSLRLAPIMQKADNEAKVIIIAAVHVAS